MYGRKHMGKASPLLLFLGVLASFFATYNFLTMVIHNHRREATLQLGIGIAQNPVIKMPKELNRPAGPRRPFHVVLTATDAAYSKWQCRIMHYWYKQMRDQEGSEVGGFTRVLHSGKPDNLMEEIPTVVVDPLPAGLCCSE